MALTELEKALGLKTDDFLTPTVTEKKEVAPVTQNDDSKFSKEKLKEVITRAESTLDDLYDLATDTGESKYFKNIADILNVIRQSTLNIMDVEESKTKIDVAKNKKDEPKTSISQKNTNIFVGTLKEILDEQKRQLENIKVIDNDVRSDESTEL